MANAASERNNGSPHIKKYKVYCPELDTDIYVIGTWEQKYAIYLNINSIKWTKPNKDNKLQYKLHNEDYNHSYYPDFFLVDSNEYIEIKGRWWVSKDGRVNDKRKMQMVFEQNPLIKIKILEKNDLLKLNIKL